MKVAKFFLVLLLVVIGVLFLALVVVWGLKLGGNWTASNDEPRVYSQQEREEIIASLDAEPGPVYTPEEQQAVVQSLND